MSESRRRILDLLAGGKITADEAERLLAAVDQPGSENVAPGGVSPRKDERKFLRVVVEPEAGSNSGTQTRVNVRVPMALIRAGVKFTSLIPPHASKHINENLREHGMDIDLKNLRPEDLEQMVEAMQDLEVNVDDGKEKVRVYFE